MPIYEYRCDSCGFQKEYILRMSDAPLTVCPECQKATFSKMVTAAGFQLKGAGWYVTDYSSKLKETGANKSDKTEKSEKSESADKSDKPEKSSPTESTAKTESSSNSTSDTAASSKQETTVKKD